MTKSSKPSKTISSAETEEIVKDFIIRIEKFKAEADSILSEYQPTPVVEEADKIIENIFLKFHSVVLETTRRYDNRSTLRITDEYDVQDLLRSLLTLHFDDIRKEEWTPSYAGGSKRIDFLLKEEKIAIETKMTREGLTARKLGDDLIVDIAHYQEHPHCKSLFCLVYDPEYRLSNPRGLEKDLTRKHEKLDVKVFIVPRRV